MSSCALEDDVPDAAAVGDSTFFGWRVIGVAA